MTLPHLSPTRGDPLWTTCSTTANFTTNSIYQSNLNTLLLNLTKSSATGFATDSIGQPPNQAHGLALCRGDVNATACSSCLNTASQDILNLCPYNKGAIVWYDLCQLHYSNAQILSTDEYAPVFFMWNMKNAPDPTGMNAAAGVLIGKIINWAAYNTSKRFATGEMSYTAEYPKIYGLVQCNRDLSGDQCLQCLQQIEASLPAGRIGARVLGASCNMRYEVYSFYDGRSSLVISPPSPPPSPSPHPAINGTAALLPSVQPPASNQTRGNKKSSTGMILTIAIPLVITLLLIFFIYIYCFRIRSSAKKLPDTSKPEEITSVESI